MLISEFANSKIEFENGRNETKQQKAEEKRIGQRRTADEKEGRKDISLRFNRIFQILSLLFLSKIRVTDKKEKTKIVGEEDEERKNRLKSQYN